MNFDAFAPHEDRRRLHLGIVIATVAEIDHERQAFRARRGDILTHWLPFPAEISAIKKAWRPLKLGTQIILASESGELNGASLVGMLWAEALPPPSLPLEKREHCELIEYEDGTRILYDMQSKTLSLSGDVDLNIRARTVNVQAQNFTYNHREVKTI